MVDLMNALLWVWANDNDRHTRWARVHDAFKVIVIIYLYNIHICGIMKLKWT